MLDRRAKLAHVSRPVVSQQRVHRFRRNIDNVFVVRLGKLSQERAYQQRNIVFSLAQRRHDDPHDVEAKI